MNIRKIILKKIAALVTNLKFIREISYFSKK